MSQELAKKIEALLFVSGEPIGLSGLSKILKKDEDEIKKAIGKLEENLSERGVRLARKENRYTLVTRPEEAGVIRDFMKEELGEDLSKAALETLSVIVYKEPLTRSQIDYIRGVNSSFTLRNLMIRGLIERRPDPNDLRQWLYSPSFGFLKYMGLENLEKLPGYGEFRREMDELLARQVREGEEEL